MITNQHFPFDEIREVQRNTLDRLNEFWDDPNIRYVIFQGATGIGKSALAKSMLNSTKGGMIITSTKQLQDQYDNDFDDITSIKGRENYTCKMYPRFNCAQAPCNFNSNVYERCVSTHGRSYCEYTYKSKSAALAKQVVTSYPFFLTSIEYSKNLPIRDMLIFDECHTLESQITNWASLYLNLHDLYDKYKILDESNGDIKQIIVLSVPPDKPGFNENKEWLECLFDLIQKRRLNLYQQLRTTGNPNDLTDVELTRLCSQNKDYQFFDRVYRRLRVLMNSTRPEDWLVEVMDNGLLIQPTATDNLFNAYVDKWAKEKIIFMSATILDGKGFCNEMGLPIERTKFINVNSTFNPKKAPIYSLNTCGTNYNVLNENLMKITDEVRKIMNRHPNDKGIIHTGNYKVAKAIIENLSDERLICKSDDETNEDLVSRHKSSNKPTILVSPSLTTGTDLYDNLSRFQIIVKLPWVSLQDKRVKRKLELDKLRGDNWYACEMLKALIQACGRSIRSNNDWAVTYILDNKFNYWIRKYKSWLPQYFIDRIHWNTKL